jgi:hypothetical protein
MNMKIYNDLKPKQQAYIQLLDKAFEGTVDADTTFTRGYLKKVANDNGIAWAPAWIVKDVSRVRGRGAYVVPELASYRGVNIDRTEKPVASVGDKPKAAPVETVAPEIRVPARPVIQAEKVYGIDKAAWGLLTDAEQADIAARHAEGVA